jgi:hypothetical protein
MLVCWSKVCGTPTLPIRNSPLRGSQAQFLHLNRDAFLHFLAHLSWPFAGSAGHNLEDALPPGCCCCLDSLFAWSPLPFPLLTSGSVNKTLLFGSTDYTCIVLLSMGTCCCRSSGLVSCTPSLGATATCAVSPLHPVGYQQSKYEEQGNHLISRDPHHALLGLGRSSESSSPSPRGAS